MKKSLISVALVLSFASALFGFEWGGMIDNATVAQTSDFKDVSLIQSNGIHLNLTSSLNKDKTLRFATEAMYKYNLNIEDKEGTLTNIVDLSLLKLSGNWNINGASLSMNLGRFNYSDKTGFAFGQTSDGLNVNYVSRNWSVGAYAGYTGLVNRFTTPMTDQLEEQKMAQLYDLSYGYVPLMIDFTLTNVGGNVIGIQGEYFLDITNKKDKAYGSLFVKGPLGSVGTYYAAATVGTNKFNDIMLRANMNFQFVFGNSLMLGIGADYSSGNSTLAPFTSITLRPLHFMIDGIDGIIPRLSLTYAIDNFVVAVTEKVVMTIPSSFELNGVDSNVSLVYNLFSDLQLGTSINAYTDFGSKDNNKFNVSVNAGFTF